MRYLRTCFAVLIIIIISGCSASDNRQYPSGGSPLVTSIDDMLLVDAPNIDVLQDSHALIDYSNRTSGYIGVKRQDQGTKKYKVQIGKAEEKYNYDLNGMDYNYYPLQMGNGTYRVKVLEQIQGEEYAVMLSNEFEVNLISEQIPFLYSNQYVDYTKDSKAIKKGFDLCKGDKKNVERIYHIYDYITSTIKYDDDKREYVKDKFVLPVIDQVLKTKKGICFDYASLMCAMLRSQKIPAKLVIGYTSEEYHAWVEIWVEKKGWITPDRYLKEEKWTLVDPTFDSMSKNYNGKYIKKKVY
ncbi:MAG: transglutaminase-like domain-containing protein [Erysipelotrichaceae bacterium]